MDNTALYEDIIRGYRVLCTTLQRIEQQKSAEWTPPMLASTFRFTSTTPETLQQLDLPMELLTLSRHLRDRENCI